MNSLSFKNFFKIPQNILIATNFKPSSTTLAEIFYVLQ